jgi:hypothetical protein
MIFGMILALDSFCSIPWLLVGESENIFCNPAACQFIANHHPVFVQRFCCYGDELIVSEPDGNRNAKPGRMAVNSTPS